MVHKTDSAFFLSAMAAPVALTCCTLPWQWAAAALALFGVVVTLFRHLANRCDIFQGLSCLPAWLRGIVCAGEIATIFLASGWVIGHVVAYFPSTKYPWVAALFLAALAAYGAVLPLGQLKQCGAVVSYVLAVLFGVVVLFSLQTVEVDWLLERRGGQYVLPALGILLFAALYQASGGYCGRGPVLTLGIFGLLVSVVSFGVVGSSVALGNSQALLEVSKTVSIGRVAERFEPLAAAGMVLSAFCFLSAAGSLMCRFLGQKVVQTRKNTCLVLSCAGSLLGLAAQSWLNTWLYLTLVAIFWVIVPSLALFLGRQNKETKES